MSSNPLEKLYRSKKLYISLPSLGRFYTQGITLSADGEIGIMPMTATDEIKLKSPDSLFNGEALYELFQSCVPDIADPREIPNCDVDKLLLGIRVATTGTDLDISSTCPKCGSQDDFVIDLTVIMNSTQEIAKDNTVELEDVTVHVRPLTLKNQVIAQVESFYQYRMQQTLLEDKLTEEQRIEMFNESLLQAITIKTTQVAECIERVILHNEEQAVVDNREHIFGWVKNMDSSTHNKIQEKIIELGNPKMNNRVEIQCSNAECGHHYKTQVDLNPVNFF